MYISSFSLVVTVGLLLNSIMSLDAAQSIPLSDVVDTGTYDVRSFGAVGDGVTSNTSAIQRAVDIVNQKGGGSIFFPGPGTYLTGTIFLKDNVVLDIRVGATLLGSQKYADYRADTGLCAYPEGIDRCLIYAKNATHIGLTGFGAISGNGKPQELLSDNPANGRTQRPMLVRFEDCKDVHVDQLTLSEAFSWCFHFKQCTDVRIQGLNIFNRRQDGIDLESCENVTIADCNIKAGDDAIVLLTDKNIPTHNVTITNCLLQSKWAGLRFGPLSYGDINNIAVSNCVIHDCCGGGIKIAMLEGGEIRDCTFSNITMEKVTSPILIMLTDWKQVGNPQPATMMPLGKISHLTFSHIVGTATMDTGMSYTPDGDGPIFLQGHPHQDLEDISLNDIDLSFLGGGTLEEAARRDMPDADSMPHSGTWPEHDHWGVPPAAALYARHVRGLTLDRVRFTFMQPDLRPAVFVYQSSEVTIDALSTEASRNQTAGQITLRDCQNALITDCQDHQGGAAFLSLEGGQTRRISLLGNSLTGFANPIHRAVETPASAVLSDSLDQAGPSNRATPNKDDK